MDGSATTLAGLIVALIIAIAGTFVRRRENPEGRAVVTLDTVNTNLVEEIGRLKGDVNESRGERDEARANAASYRFERDRALDSAQYVLVLLGEYQEYTRELEIKHGEPHRAWPDPEEIPPT